MKKCILRWDLNYGSCVPNHAHMFRDHIPGLAERMANFLGEPLWSLLVKFTLNNGEIPVYVEEE